MKFVVVALMFISSTVFAASSADNGVYNVNCDTSNLSINGTFNLKFDTGVPSGPGTVVVTAKKDANAKGGFILSSEMEISTLSTSDLNLSVFVAAGAPAKWPSDYAFIPHLYVRVKPILRSIKNNVEFDIKFPQDKDKNGDAKLVHVEAPMDCSFKAAP